MAEKVCTNGICSACGACENICPKSCITRQKENGSFYMVKGDSCIHCNLCSKVCPVSGDVTLHPPLKAYAGWSTDENCRRLSASGGIAASIYQYAINQNALFTGAYMDDNFECHLAVGSSTSDIEKFRNSKYTYSYPDHIYQQTASEIKKGSTVFFIGLPCQTAALRKYFDTLQICSDQLYTIDIVCHGTPDPEFLKQHIAFISNKKGAKPAHCFFRDSRFGTSNFVYTLYENHSETPYYVKYVNQDDYYQIGYHRALIYRDSCYSCKFAQPNRPGDITIGDFHVSEEFSSDTGKDNVSAVLANTPKGLSLLQALTEANILHLSEKPVEAIIQGEGQLRHPSVAGPERIKFLNAYHQKQDYDTACKNAFQVMAIKNTLQLGKIKYTIKHTLQSVVHPSKEKR